MAPAPPAPGAPPERPRRRERGRAGLELPTPAGGGGGVPWAGDGPPSRRAGAWSVLLAPWGAGYPLGVPAALKAGDAGGLPGSWGTAGLGVLGTSWDSGDLFGRGVLWVPLMVGPRGDCRPLWGAAGFEVLLHAHGDPTMGLCMVPWLYLGSPAVNSVSSPDPSEQDKPRLSLLMPCVVSSPQRIGRCWWKVLLGSRGEGARKGVDVL